MKVPGSIGTTIVAATVLTGLAGINAAARENKFEFPMKRGAKLVASGCLPNAAARVSIKPDGPVEVMDVNVEGLPPNTEFDFFVIQKPGAPFGLAGIREISRPMTTAKVTDASSAASTKRPSSSRRLPRCRLLRCTTTRFLTRASIR
jgi:hypothetical protein